MDTLITIGMGLATVVGMILSALFFGEKRGRDKEVKKQLAKSLENERTRNNVEDQVRRAHVDVTDAGVDGLHDKFYRD